MTVNEAYKEKIENNKYKVVACRYNNEYRNLETEIEEGSKIELIDVSSKEGMKVYVRTLVYIMGKAFEKLYPKEKLMVEYQLGNAMYCKCDKVEITKEFLKLLKNNMQEIIDRDLKITKEIVTREQAQKFYEENETSKPKD